MATFCDELRVGWPWIGWHPSASASWTLLHPPPTRTDPLLSLSPLQAKKLDEIRTEAAAELGILDPASLGIPGLDALVPAIPGLAAPKRPQELELFPAFK